MPQIRLTDQVYKEAERRAIQAGFASVDEFVTEIVEFELEQETADLDHLFTPERLAHIDQAAAQIDAGQSFTSQEADAELAKRRDEWLKNQH